MHRGNKAWLVLLVQKHAAVNPRQDSSPAQWCHESRLRFYTKQAITFKRCLALPSAWSLYFFSQSSAEGATSLTRSSASRPGRMPRPSQRTASVSLAPEYHHYFNWPNLRAWNTLIWLRLFPPVPDAAAWFNRYSAEFTGSQHQPQHHAAFLTESQNSRGWKGPLWVI